MIQPLTPEQKAELNAWIAEHVYGWKWYEATTYLPRRILPPDADPINSTSLLPDYADKWSAAGPLFDRYDGWYLHRWTVNEHVIYSVYAHIGDIEDGVNLAEAPTGPEAIAKAVRAYEERKQG